MDNLWHILTTSGTDLLVEKIIHILNNFFLWIIQISDYAILVAMIFALIAIFGSRSAVKGIYWTFASYIILKFLGVVIR